MSDDEVEIGNWEGLVFLPESIMGPVSSVSFPTVARNVSSKAQFLYLTGIHKIRLGTV